MAFAKMQPANAPIMTLACAGLVLIGTVLAPAAAHDLWIEPTGDGLVLLRGHRHSGHAGAEVMPIDPAHLLSVDCLQADGTIVAHDVAEHTAGDSLRLDCSGPAVQVTLSSGFWTKTVRGTRNVPRRQAEHALSSWRSFETVIFLRHWHPRLAHGWGDRLAILPDAAEETWSVGDKATFRVTLAGEPVADAVVRYHGKPRGTSGKDGTINIRLREAGLQMLQASLRRPTDDPDADEVIDTATLNFMIEAHP